MLKDAAEYEKYSALTVEKDAVAFDAVTKEMTFEVNQVKGLGWRLVHDGKAVKMLDYHDGVTTSVHEIETFATLKGCTDRITELGLEIDDTTLEGATYEAEKTGTVEPVVTEPIGDISKTK